MSAQAEERQYESTPGPSTMGRSIVYIRCPFCRETVTAYLWSLAGKGKRCPCGAKHTAYGFTIAPRSAQTGVGGKETPPGGQ